MTSTWGTSGWLVFCACAVGLCGGMCSRLCVVFSRRARLTAGFLRSVASLCDSPKNLCRSVILAGTGGLKAAFFCLLFFAAAKKSRCRPAQGQRVKHRYETADASAAKTRKPKKRKAKKPGMPTSVADKKKQTLPHTRHNPCAICAQPHTELR